ncbi:hypothetical protein BJ994_000976 [Arthrobacter pigmenti]|uniref:Uncharacterized protein n=1 Tax=Arthrobacter pigmenti TaxID=271432 RepID=A0A846RJQ5_9MICC|nr:hypothetical protein [Arthrobacter pigmenti]NJC21900.1 hypothetical protein [Arthrobacter pigmenti]
MISVAVVEQQVSAPRPGAGSTAEGPLLGEFLRLFAAFAALGAGLSFFALAANALLEPGVTPTATLAGTAAGGWALLHTFLGLAALRGEDPASRVLAAVLLTVRRALPVVAAVVLGALTWGALLAPADLRRFDLTLACALALLLLQLCCRGALRRTAGRGIQSSPGKLLGVLFCAALVVAAITTPGLAASTAGDFAVPHGEHGTAPGTPPVPAEHPGH